MSISNEHLLSKREFQVYQHIICGESQKEIADKLFICVRTVKFHSGNIYQKLNVKNKVELIKQIQQEEALALRKMNVAETIPKFS
ncbi:response regulator transcription factor [Psychrosphaera ytuae]|uniref:Response regulator transcription factor n=1 Tax=Psychrosphaera ytuae TaxID=2820710 RepID=A0A975DBG9_9GAMM|nr:LuxR C-terminal-related transcriptional regulator [Psychrosphaera ytuae]QTH63251.1 response regulator transcription factor [Psychrosphaera ytuae]